MNSTSKTPPVTEQVNVSSGARCRCRGWALQVLLGGGGERSPSCSRRTAGASSKQAFVTLFRLFLVFDSNLVRLFVGMSEGRCQGQQYSTQSRILALTNSLLQDSLNLCPKIVTEKVVPIVVPTRVDDHIRQEFSKALN